MRKLHSWKALVGVSILLIGLGFVASPSHLVRAVTTITQIGADINGTAADDDSGFSVAMSADGTRVAIGAWQDSSNRPGYVRVYQLTNGAWTQTGSDIIGAAVNDLFGYSVAISADGTRVAVGATQSNRGYVRIHTWNGNTWTTTGDPIIGEGAADESGNSVAMSADGTRVAIGASWNNGGRGHVRVHTLNGNTWTQTGGDIDGEASGDRSGSSVAMSADGTRVAIGARDNGGTDDEAGHVRIYSWNGTAWTQTGADIDGEAEEDFSGGSVAMSADGNRVAIGASENDGGGNRAGHVRVHTWNGTAWIRTGDDIDGEAANDYSGGSVAMSADGNRVAIGARYNDGSFSDAGHVRIYTWNGTAWIQSGSDINGAAANDYSGGSVAMSGDGTRVAIGAELNDAGGTDAGHVRIYGVQNLPSAPTISAVTPGDSSLRVSFTPGNNGGSAITNYKYSIDGTNYVALNPAAATSSPISISGLTNGTSYSVSIKSVNAIGDSPASNAITASPAAPAANVAPTTTIAAPTNAVAAPTATPKKVDSLPATGNNSSTLVFISALLVIGGITLSRRRKLL